jgi:Uma2 family endonuclease
MTEMVVGRRIVLRAPLPILFRAEQTMGMPAITRRWTAADVRALTTEDRAWPRYELIDGELLVTPGPRTAHQFAITELLLLLCPYVEAMSIGLTLPSPSELELKPGTITQPDVFVIPAETRIAGDAIEWPDVKSLVLAVEVLSPSSLRTDRVKKRDFYLENGVEEYWIVDLDARVVERWRPEQETPELLRDQLEWAPRGGAPLVIELPAYFDRIERKAAMFARWAAR